MLQQDTNNLERWVPLIITALNGLSLIYFAWKRNQPEVKKLDAEADLENVETANVNLEGARVSGQLLMERINDLKKELEAERALRKEELQTERAARAAELQTERDARKKEGEYLRRRIKEAEREARDYRQWAARLVKQVVEAGKVPSAFIPGINGDSETDISAITKEQIEKESKGEK